MDRERGSLIPLDIESPKKDMQLRVIPSEVKFLDTLVGRVYRLPITVHNLGRSTQKIRFQEPIKPQFKLILTNLDKTLASGLQMTAMVEYHPDKDEDTSDQLLISVGNKTIGIPLIGLIPICQLEIESVVNFGTLVSNSNVYCKELTIINHGKAPGQYFLVSLQGRPDVLLNIKAHVVEQIIELLHMNSDKKLECIRFGSIFFGTSKLEHAHLYNNSPESMNWVAIMQDNSVGEELGTNIQQRTDIALNNLTYLNKIKDVDVTDLISCVPNEGALLPYQKTIITFCFSPKLLVDTKKDIEPSHRQDYALFMRFECVGSKDGYLRDENCKTIKSDRFQKVELALTGSGIPVLLQFNPGKVLNFTPCVMGECSEIQFIVQNQSKSLPVMYHFKKTGNFKIDPERGMINEGYSQNVKCSFIPHQIGVFKVKQLVEIIGPVVNENLLSLSMKPFHHIYLDFNSICKAATKKVVMKINPGISPLVSNPTGLFVAKDLAKYKDSAPVAMLQSAKTYIHNHRSNKESVKDVLIAFPNDRAASIRSGDHDKHFRECVFSHNDIDIGLQPASGLKSPSLSEAEVEEELASAECPIKPNQMLSARNIESREKASLRRKVHETFKSEPSTLQEKNDCSIILTPKHIHQVIVGPSVLNFGNICVNSTSDHLLHVINMLPIHILIQFDTNLEELRKTKQFSYVIPPTCNTNISVTFQFTMLGKFWKSFTFTVNNTPSGHILVMAVVRPVKLELSSDELVLRPQGFLVKTWFRGTIRLHNRQNCSAQFGWQPVNTGRGMAFSIRPANGLDDTVTYFSCEATGSLEIKDSFTLVMASGSQKPLGHTKVTFLERKIFFSNCPQGLTTWRKAILHNVGQNHAYFQVCGQSLLPIIDIIPSQGIIPVGGLTVLNISCTPTVAEKFDTRAQVAIRCGNVIDLKIGGSVEIADVEINPDVFNFSGTYIGTTQIIPFVIKNKGITRARVEFNLEDFPEFSMDLKDKSASAIKDSSPPSNQTRWNNLVTTYDFIIQVKINFFEASKLYTEYSSSSLNPKTTPLIRPCCVQVTDHPKKCAVDIPMRLNDNPFCYQMLHLTGEVKSPKLLFDPPFIFFTPVPLDITTVMDINILPQNYFRSSTLHVQIPTARLLDGNEIHPLSVKFSKGRVITGSPSGINNTLTCHLSFKSSKPVSFFTNLLFCDDRNNWFSLPVTATAENCILTIYPYIAIHLDRHRIRLKNDQHGSPVKTRESDLLSHQDARSPSLTSIRKTSTSTKFGDAEPERRNLFVGMEIIPENLGLDDNEASKKDDRFVKKEETNEQSYTLGEGTKAYNFFQKVVNAAQTWFGLFGWPEGPHSLSIPETIRRDVYKIQFSSKSSPQKFSRQNDFSKYNKTIYDVVLHLSGIMPPGISSSQSLPVDNNERVIQLHFQHSSLLDFLNTQGACISHVLPEFLLEPEDYKKWMEITSSTNTVPVNSYTHKERCSVVIEMTEFEAWSKRAWTDVFLQIYKVLVLSRVVPYSSSTMPPIHLQNTPKINPCFVSSNIYSDSERILLSWLNTNYESTRHVIWKSCHEDIIPSERWIVNFDKDLVDGLVFATQLAAYCPFLIESHFINMYTRPKRPEQYLHNNIIVINAFREIGFDMNVQAIDICDANPILMLMLCVYMYERLPTYLPRKVVPFHCTLHDTVLRQIQLKNPSLQSLVYNAKIVGRDAADFSLSQTGNVVTISPKNQINITLKFTSRFLHPAKASLLLISKPKNATGGTTMAFALKGIVINFKAILLSCLNIIFYHEYMVKKKIILVESSTFVSLPSQLTESGQYMKHDDSVRSSGCDSLQGCSHAPEALRTSIKSDFIKEFFCSMPTVYLDVKETSNLELFFLPFNIHVRYCAIIFTNKNIGEFIYVLEGKGMIPLPSRFLPMHPPSSPVSYGSTSEEGFNEEDAVLYLKCELHQILDVELKLPLMNEAKEKAFIFAAHQQMSNIEYERRLITGTLESSSIRVAIALLGLSKIESGTLFHTSELKKAKSILYTTQVSLPEHFLIPKNIYIPQIPEVPVSFKLLIIENKTNKEWRYQVTIEGEWFYGPSVLHVGPEKTVEYPLTFRPIFECEIMGKLVLRNEVDGVEHMFHIKGIGKKPLAVEHITLECEVGETIIKHIMVPNYTNSPLKLEIAGTISFSGKSKQASHVKGETDQDRKLSFQKSLTEVIHNFDDEDTDDNVSNFIIIWYSLEIHSTPGLPINIIEMDCTALDTICIEIPLSNPKDRIVNLDVKFTSPALDGDEKVTLNPLECTSYVVQYSPATTGYRNERFATQMVPLTNPTHETLELQATNSNPENFVLDINETSQLILTPHSTTELSVHFYPSMLGRAGHQACIDFSCTQFQEWKFYLSGIGLFPKPLDLAKITTCIGWRSPITIPFKNPTNEDVFIDILLTSQEEPKHLVFDQCWDSFFHENIAFKLTAMSQTQGIALPPKGNVDILVLFVPPSLKLYKTIVIVQMMRANTKSWPIDNFDELDINMKRTMGVDSGEIQAIHWMYPILGLPQTPFPKSPSAVIQCQSRKRVEENVEVTLCGDFFGNHPTPEMTEFLVIPNKNSYNFYDGFSELPKKREFEYEIQFESEVMESHLEPCVALYMIDKTCSIKDERITLIFKLVFTPQKPLRTNITLKIQCLTDGIWTFPIMLVATEPDVDAVINIVGVGLFKESIVDFRLTSQTRNSEPFTARFLPGSDPEFSVRPQAGKLLPYNTKGTLIMVGFKPRMYSRKYKATLAIETADMYWLYDINGIPHSGMPPMNVKAKIDATNKIYDHNKPVRRRNFIRENAKLLSTGVSSTIKGAPLMKNK
ncbi:PREDICTED: calponin homology domain-containing protein 2 [Propithecus coquereli]|uniref:calponin homology domain-containing protein 2 n=1 Tax=Propithecus coquereli TaxID=379532 RepID=UPI00063EF268|nr:PREDICTED: calponin homology domain-containing protein 2 [Propithecus coquereli]